MSNARQEPKRSRRDGARLGPCDAPDGMDKLSEGRCYTRRESWYFFKMSAVKRHEQEEWREAEVLVVCYRNVMVDAGHGRSKSLTEYSGLCHA